MQATIVHNDRAYFKELPDLAKKINISYTDVFSIRDLLASIDRDKPDFIVFDNNLSKYTNPSIQNLISYIKNHCKSYTVILVEDKNEMDGINGVKAGADCYITESNLNEKTLKEKLDYVQNKYNLNKDIYCLQHISER